jgi:hypothetical protein
VTEALVAKGGGPGAGPETARSAPTSPFSAATAQPPRGRSRRGRRPRDCAASCWPATSCRQRCATGAGAGRWPRHCALRGWSAGAVAAAAAGAACCGTRPTRPSPAIGEHRGGGGPRAPMLPIELVESEFVSTRVLLHAIVQGHVLFFADCVAATGRNRRARRCSRCSSTAAARRSTRCSPAAASARRCGTCWPG